MTEVAEHVEGVDGGVVVGLDGSGAAVRALSIAADEARAHRLPLHIVRAWTVTNAPRPASCPPGYVPSYAEFEAAVREEMTRDAVEVLGPDPDIDVHLHPVRGAAAKKLLEASQTAALVVVGSRGRGGFAGLLLGSTSDQVVRYAKCSVLVVRAADPGAAAAR